ARSLSRATKETREAPAGSPKTSAQAGGFVVETLGREVYPARRRRRGKPQRDHQRPRRKPGAVSLKSWGEKFIPRDEGDAGSPSGITKDLGASRGLCR